MPKSKSDPNKPLTPLQNKALCLLASGKGVKEVADELNVSCKIIYDWQKKPTFQKMLNDGVMATYDAAIATLISGCELASKELIDIIKDKDTPTKIKVNAINTLLNYATKAKDSYLNQQSDTIDIIDTEVVDIKYE